MRAKIERYGLTRTIDPRHFFPTIEAAIAAFRQQTGAHWAPAAQAADGQTAPGHTAADTGPAARPPRITTGRLGAAGSGTIRRPAATVYFQRVDIVRRPV